MYAPVYIQINIFEIILGNDESDESEESHDEDEEELRTSDSPARNNNELEPDSLDDLNDTPDLNTSDQSTLWNMQ